MVERKVGEMSGHNSNRVRSTLLTAVLFTGLALLPSFSWGQRSKGQSDRGQSDRGQAQPDQKARSQPERAPAQERAAPVRPRHLGRSWSLLRPGQALAQRDPPWACAAASSRPRGPMLSDGIASLSNLSRRERVFLSRDGASSAWPPATSARPSRGGSSHPRATFTSSTASAPGRQLLPQSGATASATLRRARESGPPAPPAISKGGPKSNPPSLLVVSRDRPESGPPSLRLVSRDRSESGLVLAGASSSPACPAGRRPRASAPVLQSVGPRQAGLPGRMW